MAGPLVKPILCPTLIGRGTYLSAFHDCLKEAAAGHGQVVLVSGEAGIGKSRLISEVSAFGVSYGFCVVTGYCYEEDQALPYAPLLDVFRHLLRAARREIPAQTLWPFASELIRLLPDQADVFSQVPLEMAAEHEPEWEKRRLARAFTLLISEIAARQPVFLFIEDLQWCDEASLDVLLHLARHIDSHSVLLVLTHRSDEVPDRLGHMLTQLDRERLAAEMRLSPLSVGEVEDMLQAIFAMTQPVQADHLNLVYGLCDGNPFFVEEMLRTLVSGGMALSPEALTERFPLDTLHVPRTVEEAVQRRVAQLSSGARRLVALAAVAGRTFTFSLLQALTQQDERQVLEHLKELIAAQLIIEISDERFSFRHALTRQAVYTGLLARERMGLHLAIANVLENANVPLDDAHLGDLAYHFAKAAAWRQALTYAHNAGERALALYAPRAALEHLVRALDAAEHLKDVPPNTLAALHRLCGQAYEILGDFEAAREHFDAALQRARSSENDAIAWSSLIDLGDLWAGRDYQESGVFYQQAIELTQPREDTRQHAHGLNRWGNWCANIGHMDEAIAAHQQALTLFANQNHLAGQATTHDLLGMAYGLGANLPGAVQEFNCAIELLRRLGTKSSLCLCLASRLAFGSGCMADTTISALLPLDECLRDAHEAEQYARDMEWFAGQAYVFLQMGRAEVAFGLLGSGLAHIREALSIACKIEHHQWIAAAHFALGRTYLTLCMPGRAIPELESGLAIAQKLGSAVWKGLITADLVGAYRQSGELDKAEKLLFDRLPLDVLHSQRPLTLAERELALQQAEMQIQRGDPEAALEIVAKLFEQVHDLGSDQPIAELLRVQGEAFMHLRRWDAAERVLEEAKRGSFQRMSLSSLWRSQTSLARLYHMTKQENRVRQEWSSLQQTLERLAITIEEADLRDAFLQAATLTFPKVARISPQRRHPHLPNMLTKREHEVAALIAQGKSNHEIADALVVSERTITTHVSNILGKLGFTSRTQIVAWLIASNKDA